MAFQKAISVRVDHTYLALLYAIRQEHGAKVNNMINEAIGDYLGKKYNCEPWRLERLAREFPARQFLDAVRAGI